eukprot:607507-Hanusia_phi.AAC.1
MSNEELRSLAETQRVEVRGAAAAEKKLTGLQEERRRNDRMAKVERIIGELRDEQAEEERRETRKAEGSQDGILDGVEEQKRHSLNVLER